MEQSDEGAFTLTGGALDEHYSPLSVIGDNLLEVNGIT